MIGFIRDTGIAGADINFNLEVGKRLDTFAVDVGGIEFGGGAVDGAVFVSPAVVVVSPANEDIMDLLAVNRIVLSVKSEKIKNDKNRLKIFIKFHQIIR